MPTDPTLIKLRVLMVFVAAAVVVGSVRLNTPPSPPRDPPAALAPGRPTGSLAAMPKAYRCHCSPHPVAVSGRGDDPAWAVADWTDDFVDIQGDAKPRPRFRTRAKLLWDDRFLYVFAQLDDPHVWATITKRNSVIFHDNDFEVFLDPGGGGEHYYEFEVNALNTVWELTLPKRYSRGGKPVDPSPLAGLVTSVHVDGTLNDPSDVDRGWTVEAAFPFAGLAGRGARTPPAAGDAWRVNFSRVQWTHAVVDGRYVKPPRERVPEDNWVWSPQGVVDMHQPEHWGVVTFDRE